MSDEIDTDMIEEAMIVIEQACTHLRKTVLKRATHEMDRQTRDRADDVIVCFDAVRYAGHRRSKDLMLLELEQLCQKIDRLQEWSIINRPFDSATYQQVLDKVELAQGAIYSALGIHRPCRQLIPLTGLRI